MLTDPNATDYLALQCAGEMVTADADFYRWYDLHERAAWIRHCRLQQPAVAARPVMPRRKKKKVTSGRKAKTEKKVRRAGERRHAQKKEPSKYKGVSKCVGPQGVKFEARFWDGKHKKLKYLGRFDNEIEAALTAAKARGDSDEIRRLSDIAEQMENNPDRPDGRTFTPKAGTGAKHDYETTEEPKVAYRCKHCRLTYQSRPTSCPHCNSAAFDEVPNPDKQK